MTLAPDVLDAPAEKLADDEMWNVVGTFDPNEILTAIRVPLERCPLCSERVLARYRLLDWPGVTAWGHAASRRLCVKGLP